MNFLSHYINPPMMPLYQAQTFGEPVPCQHRWVTEVEVHFAGEKSTIPGCIAGTIIGGTSPCSTPYENWLEPGDIFCATCGMKASEVAAESTQVDPPSLTTA